MQDTGNQTKQTPDGHPAGFWHHTWHHIVDKWPETVLVAAVVTIMHLHPSHFGWFKAIDRYAYVVIGNLSTLLGPVQNNSLKASLPVVVVGIDSETHKSEYLERSPLNRCVIRDHLSKIYDLEPKLVIVDLDLSPGPKPGTEAQPSKPHKHSPSKKDYGWGDEITCQRELNDFIKERTREGAKIVIAAPFGDEWSDDQKEWVCEMERANVRFGSAKLPVEYGVVLSHYTDPRTLAQTAKALLNDIEYIPEKCGDGNPFQPSEANSALLNFKAYQPVPLAIELANWNEEKGKPHGDVVFFGAMYGEEDRHLTPVDELYGVNLHAVAFVSAFYKVNEHDTFWGHIQSFCLDVLFAFIFGIVIAKCWHRYFILRLDSTSATKQQFAPVYVIALLAGVLMGILLLLWISLYFLSEHGIWTSPVPIAIGMLFESFVSGSVAQAIRVERESTDRQSRSAPVEEISLWQSVRNFTYLDCWRLWDGKKESEAVILLGLGRPAWLGIVWNGKKEPGAAILLGLRRLVWLGIVVFAFWSMSHPS